MSLSIVESETYELDETQSESRVVKYSRTKEKSRNSRNFRPSKYTRYTVCIVAMAEQLSSNKSFSANDKVFKKN